ncbi:MAG: MFS transporter [Leptolyngbya sp. PLA3]|nr:MAG: MFS transporter [Cyanobacteria bacterium CYA]MCE7969495.1 MFS transporter [Leptolyngbya sp. PL-A3]
MPTPGSEKTRSIVLGVIASGLVAASIAVGSRNLAHFDAALVGYTFATLFAVFAIVYRYSMWLQRPPTAMYWRRGWQVFLSRDRLLGNLAAWPKRVLGVFALNNFIFRRSRPRWAAHWLIMWGCVVAAAITFPLVFGWIHFQTPPSTGGGGGDDFERYRVFIFGFPTFSFRIGSLLGGMIFHGLVWASFLVIAGVMIAMRRRMKDHGAGAVQQFAEDFLPLILLFAVSITGLMLTASYTWMRGYAYDFLAIIHAACVIFTLLWLPFGKFFHIFQRPAQIGVAFYKDAGRTGDQAVCRNCEQPFASKMHVEDLIEVERALGYSYEIPNHSCGHYQHICPRCRRLIMALAQGRLWQAGRGREVTARPGIVDVAAIMDAEPAPAQR